MSRLSRMESRKASARRRDVRGHRTTWIAAGLTIAVSASGLSLWARGDGPSDAQRPGAAGVLDTGVDPMTAGRSARQLIRNGEDYMKSYRDYDRAMVFFRAAEARKSELSEAERKQLQKGMELARQGLKRSVSEAIAARPSEKSKRSPNGKAAPALVLPALPGEELSESGSPSAESSPRALTASTPRSAESDDLDLPALPDAALAPASAMKSPDAPRPLAESALPEPVNAREPRAELPVRDSAKTPSGDPTLQAPDPSVVPEIIPAGALRRRAEQKAANTAESKPTPLAAREEEPPPTPFGQPSDSAPAEAPAPLPAARTRDTLAIPERPTNAEDSEPVKPLAPAPREVESMPPIRDEARPALPPAAEVPAENARVSTTNPEIQREVAAPAPVNRAELPPAEEALPPLPADDSPSTDVKPRGAARPSRIPGPLDAEELPALPGEAPRASSTASILSPSPAAETPSTLSPETQRRIEEIARRQDEDARRLPPQGAGLGSASRPDPTQTGLVLPRAPSPTEARPIRAIPVPGDFVPLEPRSWAPGRKYWAAAGTCHMPLYFQDAVLERYGQSVEQSFGPLGRCFSYPLDDPRQSNQRNQLLQPFYSAGMFALQIGALPYNVLMDPPWEAQYDLGYYRPGDRIPPDTYYLPWTGTGPPLRGSRY